MQCTVIRSRNATAEFPARSTSEVFRDHLKLRLENRLGEDLERNYAQDVVLLTVNSNATGHNALRMSAARLHDQLPEARFEFVAEQVHGDSALLVWRARSDRFDAIEGAGSFLIRDGKIRLHTIHYGLVGVHPQV